MKTIGQHISNLRGLLLANSRTPSSFTDQYLYEIISVARAEVLRKRLESGKKVSDNNYIKFCMELELVKDTFCDCVPVELSCMLLRTKYKLPATMVSRGNDKLEAYLISGKVINILPYKKYQLVKDQVFGYYGSVINGYLYLWNLPITLRVIEISGLFSNPVELSEIPSCNGTGVTTGTCYNVINQEFPMDDDYAMEVYTQCLKLLQIPQQQIPDLTNDSNGIIKV